MATTTTTVNVSTDGRWKYREVERGVQPFYAEGQVTGATSTAGEEARIDFCFNPDSDPTFQGFILVNRINVHTATAAAVGGWEALAIAAHWDKPTNYTNYIAGGNLVQTHSETDFAGSWYGSVNLGRISPSQTGIVRVTSDQVLNLVKTVQIEGLYSEHPVLSRWWVAA